ERTELRADGRCRRIDHALQQRLQVELRVEIGSEIAQQLGLRTRLALGLERASALLLELLALGDVLHQREEPANPAGRVAVGYVIPVHETPAAGGIHLHLIARALAGERTSYRRAHA